MGHDLKTRILYGLGLYLMLLVPCLIAVALLAGAVVSLEAHGWLARIQPAGDAFLGLAVIATARDYDLRRRADRGIGGWSTPSAGLVRPR